MNTSQQESVNRADPEAVSWLPAQHVTLNRTLLCRAPKTKELGEKSPHLHLGF